MTCLLWPGTRWLDDNAVEREVLGGRAAGVFVPDVNDVTTDQWRRCDGMMARADPLAVIRPKDVPDCKIIVTPKVGYDNFDLGVWGNAGVPVCNVPDYGTEDVADHALGLLLALVRGVGRYEQALRADPVVGWKPTEQPLAKRLRGAQMGIVGLGRIGTAMALRCKAFGMDVGFYDPYRDNGVDLALGVRRYASLAALFGAADFVSLHLPLTAETRNLINAEVLATARPGLVLVNAARGEVLDLEALAGALKNGSVGGAGLDVLPEEPLNPAEPLLAAWRRQEAWLEHRLLVTPHAGFYTPESMRDMRSKGIEVALRYLAGGRLENCVNEAFLTSRR
jgi:lactate dehydrogenase-like 2-hydroxyacid dehydrogenase